MSLKNTAAKVVLGYAAGYAVQSLMNQAKNEQAKPAPTGGYTGQEAYTGNVSRPMNEYEKTIRRCMREMDDGFTPDDDFEY